MTEEGNMTDQSLADDLLKGAEEIGAFIGGKERRIYHMLETGTLPGFKWGGIWHARKSTIIKHVDKLEDEAIS